MFAFRIVKQYGKQKRFFHCQFHYMANTLTHIYYIYSPAYRNNHCKITGSRAYAILSRKWNANSNIADFTSL